MEEACQRMEAFCLSHHISSKVEVIDDCSPAKLSRVHDDIANELNGIKPTNGHSNGDHSNGHDDDDSDELPSLPSEMGAKLSLKENAKFKMTKETAAILTALEQRQRRQSIPQGPLTSVDDLVDEMEHD